MDLSFFVECYVCDHAAAENNTAGNLNPVPIAMAVTNTGTECTCMYTAVATFVSILRWTNTVFGNVFWNLPLIM